jgi:Neurotransmitter-gated ion-channel ligand binding domain
LLAALLCVLSPVMAAAADVAHNDSLLIAPQVDGKPVQVSVGLFLTNLIDVDEVKELFQISGYLFMTWKDPRLAFSPRPGAEQREYTPDEIWIPSLLMINATAARDKVTANIKGDPDGTIHYIELFHAELTTSFFLEPFPFDSQSLEIFLQPFLDERDTVAMTYDEANSGVGTEPFVELAQWKILGFNASQQRRELGRTSKQIPELEIDLQVQRRSRYYIWKVFLPLIVMVAIAYSAFWIKIGDYYTQISITLTAILTEIAFLFAISSSLPKVPYLTFIDAFFLVSFFFSFASMLELVVVHQALELERPDHANRLRRISQLMYPVIYVLCVGAVALVFFG